MKLRAKIILTAASLALSCALLAGCGSSSGSTASSAASSEPASTVLSQASSIPLGEDNSTDALNAPFETLLNANPISNQFEIAAMNIEYDFNLPADYAVLYLRITALGTLGNLGYNMNAGILRGLGDSRSTLLLLLISCLTNIVLDVAFVAVLGMGVAGAALATTIALYLSWLASILYARRNYEGLQFPLLPHGCDKAQLAAILKVGVPLGLNNSLYSVGHVAVQAVYNMQGSVFVAGCSIAGRVTGIAGIAITSFSSAAVVFAGQNLGAGNYRRLQRGVVQITCAAGVVTLLIGLVATVFCRPLLGLFSSDPAVLDAAVLYTWWVLPFIWTYAVFNCMMSFVNGTGAVKYTTVVNLLILWAVRIPAAYILYALGYGTSSMACVSLSYAMGLVAMLGYFLTPEWGKLRRKAKELGDAVTAETEPTL